MECRFICIPFFNDGYIPMNLPTKIILIEYSNYAYFLKFKYAFVGNSLQIDTSYYQITNRSTLRVVSSSVKDNPDNEDIINTVPIQLMVNIFLSQERCFEVLLNIQKILQENINTYDLNKLIEIRIDNITTYLNIIQLNLIKSFFQPFCNDYEQIKLTLQSLKEQSPKEIKVLESNDIQLPTEINKPTAESSQLSAEDYIEEILINFSPSKIINRFIIRNMEGNLTYLNISQQDSNYTIKLTPLLKLELSNYSVLTFKSLDELIMTIDYQMSMSKINAVCKDIISIIQDETIDNYKKSIYLQLLTFLLFIYGMRNCNKRLIEGIVNFDSPFNIKPRYKNVINYSLAKYILSIKEKLGFNKITFDFVSDNADEINMDSLNLTVQKYRYLLNIDKEKFIEMVFNTKEKEKRIGKIKIQDELWLGLPRLLILKNYIDNEANTEYLLQYKLYESKYANHKIISAPYLQLLHIYYQNPIILTKQIEIDPIISKYSDILLNNIYKSLTEQSKEILKYTNSTLVILDQFIRPFIQDPSGKVEMFLLYQVLIPIIYDIDRTKTEFVDYFLA